MATAREDVRDRNWKHGEAIPGSRTSEYISWQSMMSRCYQASHTKFKHYGDRGIKVCERWHDYENFLADMGRRPTAKHTLGRIDHSKDYELSNCKWETRIEQGRQSTRVKLTLAIAREIKMMHSRGYTERELAKEFNVHHTTIHQ